MRYDVPLRYHVALIAVAVSCAGGCNMASGKLLRSWSAPDPNPDVGPGPSRLNIRSGDRVDGSLPAAEAGHEAEDAAESESVLLHVTFDNARLGRYQPEEMEAEWPGLRWYRGVDEMRVEIVDGSQALTGRSLRIMLPAGTYGVGNGAQWKVDFPGTNEQLYCSFWVRYDEGFDFVRGGKLGGLGGGEDNSGGHKPDGTDGWTARIVWRSEGRAAHYLYHPDQQDQYGDVLLYTVDGEQQYFQPGTWHHLTQRVHINTPGKHDGILQAWFDGALVVDRHDIRYRDVDTFAVDRFLFDPFFGGSDETWSTTRDEYIFFDEIVVSRGPIIADPTGDED